MDMFAKNPKRTLMSGRTGRVVSDSKPSTAGNALTATKSAGIASTRIFRTSTRQDKMKDPIPEDRDIDEDITPSVTKSTITVISEETSGNITDNKSNIPLKSILKRRDTASETIIQESEKPSVRHASFAPDESLSTVLIKPEINEPEPVIEEKVQIEAPKSKLSAPEKLSMYEYTPTSVLAIDGNNQLIRTINPLGNIVYIDFGDEFDKGDIPSEIHVTRSAQPNSVPDSVKNKSGDILLPEATGAIIEHPNRMCIMRGDQFEEYEYKDATGLVNSNPVRIYPIIRIADIETDKKSALSTTDKVNTRIANSANVMGIEDLDYFNDQYRGLGGIGLTFYNTHDKMIAHIIEQIRMLKNSMKKFVNMEAITDESREEFEKIKHSLMLHNTALYEAIKYCELMRRDAEKLEEIKNNVHTYDDELQRQFDLLKRIV